MIVYIGIRHFYIHHFFSKESATRCALVHNKQLWDFSPDLKPFGIHLQMPLSQVRRHPMVEQVIDIELNQFYPYTDPWLNICHDWCNVIQQEHPHAWYCQLSPRVSCQELWDDLATPLADQDLSAIWGAGTSKIVAKLAAHSKLSGQPIIDADATADFLRCVSIDRIPMPERKALVELGIHTIAELQQIPRNQLKKQFGHRADSLASIAQGIDPIPIYPYIKTTQAPADLAWDMDFLTDARFQTPLGPPHLQPFLQIGAQTLSELLQKRRQLAAIVALYWQDETDHSCQVRLPQPTNNKDVICRVFFAKLPQQPIHRLGLRVLKIIDAPTKQLDLFGNSQSETTAEKIAQIKRGLAVDGAWKNPTISRRERILNMWETEML